VKSSAVHVQCKKRLTLSEFSPVENSVPGNWSYKYPACGGLEVEVSVLIPLFQGLHRNSNEGFYWEWDTKLVIDCSSIGITPPTFAAPWAYRTYAVRLVFALDKYPRQELNLRIPVQVNYSTWRLLMHPIVSPHCSRTLSN
jgi:hypothetical protein